MPALLIAALAAATLLAACGDNGATPDQGGSDSAPASSDAGLADSDSESSSPATPENKTIAKAEFVRKANAICDVTVARITKQAFPEIEKASKGSAEEQASVEAELAETIVAPALRDQLEQIAALGTPPGDADQIEVIFEAIEKIGAEAEKASEEVVKRGGAFSDSSRVAENYGLTSCPYG